MARLVREGDRAFTIDTARPIAVEVCAANIVRFRVAGKAESAAASYFDRRTWPAVSNPVVCDASSLGTDELALRLHGEPQHLELCNP